MRRFLVLAAILLACPGCIHRWLATPDGKLLAGYSGNQIVVADAELKSLETYSAPGKPGNVEISPDGKWVVYNTEDASEIWLIDHTAKTQKKIGGEEGFLFYLYGAWSPTSTRLAFVQIPRKAPEKGVSNGLLRVYSVKSGEATTAIENCTGAYSWTPSGNALFAIEPYVARESEPDSVQLKVANPEFNLILWADGALARSVAHSTGPTIVEALSEDEVMFTSAIVSYPCSAGRDLSRNFNSGLFLASVSKDTLLRVGTADIVWMSLSPDRTHLLAFVRTAKEADEEAHVSLELFDAKGKFVRVLKDASAYGNTLTTFLPSWLGSDRILVPLGKEASQTFEILHADGSASEVVTEKIKAWAK